MAVKSCDLDRKHFLTDSLFAETILFNTFCAFQKNRATDENINELIDDIVSCGYSGKVSVDKKELVIR